MTNNSKNMTDIHQGLAEEISPAAEAWNIFKNNKLALWGMAIFIVFFITAVTGFIVTAGDDPILGAVGNPDIAEDIDRRTRRVSGEPLRRRAVLTDDFAGDRIHPRDRTRTRIRRDNKGQRLRNVVDLQLVARRRAVIQVQQQSLIEICVRCVGEALGQGRAGHQAEQAEHRFGVHDEFSFR